MLWTESFGVIFHTDHYENKTNNMDYGKMGAMQSSKNHREH